MPLSAEIDQTSRLASPDGRSLDERAPRLANGATVSLLNVRQSERELKRRKMLNECGLATVDEVSASQVRLNALEAATVMDAYGDALHGAAAVTQATLNQALATQTQTLTNTLTQTLTNTLTKVMSAMMSAESARRYNVMVWRNAEPANMTTELRRIPKVTAGRRDGGIIAVAGPGVPANPEDVGAVCPAVLFPHDYAALSSFTEAQIDNLSIWYNQDFGIVADDNVQARRDKFRSYIQWG